MADLKREVSTALPGDVYLAAFARATAMLGSAVVVTALLLDLHERGAGVWAVSGLLAAGTLPIVLFAPLVGLVIDRYDSRRLIVAIGLWQAVLCTLLAIVTRPYAVLVLVTLNAFGIALANPLFGSLTKAMVPPHRLAAAHSLQQGAAVIAMLAGPAVGGLLTGLSGGAEVPVLLAAVASAAVAGTGLLIRTRRRPATGGQRSRLREGVTLVLGDRALTAGAVLATLLALVGNATYAAQVFLVRDSFGASELAFGLLQATQTVGLLIGTVLASRLDTVRRILLCVPFAAAAMSVSVGLIGVARSMPATYALYLVMGVGASAVSTSVGTLLLLRVPDDAVGRTLATFNAVNRAAASIAYLIGGVVVALLPPEDVYLICGAASLSVTLAMTGTFRRALRFDCGRALPATPLGRRTPGTGSWVRSRP